MFLFLFRVLFLFPFSFHVSCPFPFLVPVPIPFPFPSPFPFAFPVSFPFPFSFPFLFPCYFSFQFPVPSPAFPFDFILRVFFPFPSTCSCFSCSCSFSFSFPFSIYLCLRICLQHNSARGFEPGLSARHAQIFTTLLTRLYQLIMSRSGGELRHGGSDGNRNSTPKTSPTAATDRNTCIHSRMLSRTTERNSATWMQTRVVQVRVEYPHQLGYSGA